MTHHVAKYTHEDGKELPRPKAWCGRIIQWSKWYYLDAQHLALTDTSYGEQPCKHCVNEIIKALRG